MKSIYLYCTVILLITYSITSYANDISINQTQHNNSYSDLVAISSPMSQLLLAQDLTAPPLADNYEFELTSKIKGEFNSPLLSIEAGMQQSKQEVNWNKYYLQGAVTLHQYDEFNVLLMANIEQINNFNHNNQKPLLDSSITLNASELSYSYGIITSYTLSPVWQFSGGIIHAKSLNESPQNTWYGDANVALIGTSYSFLINALL